MPDTFSLRDFLDARFSSLDSEMAEVKDELAKLSARERATVSACNQRFNEIEFTVQILKWVGGVLTGVAGAAILFWLGL